MTTKRIMSECHNSPHGWLPEVGSPAHERAMEARRQTTAARVKVSDPKRKHIRAGSKKNYITGFPS